MQNIQSVNLQPVMVHIVGTPYIYNNYYDIRICMYMVYSANHNV